MIISRLSNTNNIYIYFLNKYIGIKAFLSKTSYLKYFLTLTFFQNLNGWAKMSRWNLKLAQLSFKIRLMKRYVTFSIDIFAPAATRSNSSMSWIFTYLVRLEQKNICLINHLVMFLFKSVLQSLIRNFVTFSQKNRLKIFIIYFRRKMLPKWRKKINRHWASQDYCSK